MLAGVLVLAYLLAGLWFMKDTLVYALFSALLLTLMLSWGRNLMPLTDFFLDNVPGYDKFRAVTIILVIVELAAPVLGGAVPGPPDPRRRLGQGHGETFADP